MKPIIFLHKDIDETGVALSNNRKALMGCPSIAGMLMFAGLAYTHSLDNVNLNDSNGYIIHFDYEEYFRESPLYEYFDSTDILPDQVRNMIQEGKCKLYYDVSFEGHVEDKDFIELYAMLDHFGFSGKNVVYVTAALGAATIHTAYCQENNIQDPLQILAVPRFEFNTREHYQICKLKKQVSPIKRKFICLNRMARTHRLFLSACVASKQELFEQFYFSMQFPNATADWGFEAMTKYVLESHRTLPITDSDIETVADMIPILLDPNPAVTFDSYVSDINPYYAESLFNLTTESHFFDGVQRRHSTLFLTEKCFKPFIYGQIPIIMGPPMIIDYLRKMGLDMFDDIVDHSYDCLLDNDARFMAILNEVNRLNDTYSLEQCNEMNLQLHDRFLKNQKSIQLQPEIMIPALQNIKCE